MKKHDVVALGELLIDLTQNGQSEQGNPILEANPGGAPCNVLAMLARLGHSTAFIGKVGRDAFGQQLKSALDEVGIGADGLRFDDQIHTTLAVVQTMPDGDRDFSFYRNPGADVQLRPDEVDKDLVQSGRIFHFGTLSMTDEPCRAATQKALELAEKAGMLRSFDPNLRPPLWSDLEKAKEQTLYGLEHCDILKISDNEILWLTEEEDYDTAVSWIRNRYPNIKLLLLSLGAAGSRAYCGRSTAQVPAFTNVKVTDTTGAGDTFFGAVLHHVLLWGLRDYTQQELLQMLTYANAAAALITTKKGALRVMPQLQEIEQLLKKR